jgi:hypothetical protein
MDAIDALGPALESLAALPVEAAWDLVTSLVSSSQVLDGLDLHRIQLLLDECLLEVASDSISQTRQVSCGAVVCILLRQITQLHPLSTDSEIVRSLEALVEKKLMNAMVTANEGDSAVVFEIFLSHICASVASSDVYRFLFDIILNSIVRSRGQCLPQQIMQLSVLGSLLTDKFGRMPYSLFLIPWKDYVKEKLMSISIGLNNRDLSPALVKLVLGPFLTVTGSNIHGGEMIQYEESCWEFFDLLSGDLDSLSCLMCLVSSNQLTLQRLFPTMRCDQFWAFVLQFMSDSDAVNRKRGAFLIENFLIQHSEKSKGCQTAMVSDQSEVNSVEPSSRKDRKQKKKKEGKLHITANNFTDENILSTDRHWLIDFSDAYKQIEGCAYEHLIDQVWSRVSRISKIFCDYYEGIRFSSNLSVGSVEFYPCIQFAWLKVLIQCLMRVQLISVRKKTLFMIFS